MVTSNFIMIMPKRIRFKFLILLVSWPLLFLTPKISLADESLIVGVFPRRNPSEMIEMFLPLAKYLEESLNRKVVLETAPDFNAFWGLVATNRFHLVHFNQYHYIRAHRNYGYEVIAMNEEGGKSLIAGVIVTRKDSGIKSLQDLRGQTIIFGGNKHAMNSYITQIYLLRQAELNVGDYRVEFAVNPPNVALAVFFKRVIAGGMGDILYDTHFVNEKIDVNQLTTLAKSPPVSHLPWAIRSDFSENDKKNIQQILIKVKTAKQADLILKSAALSNIVISTDSQYDYVRDVVWNIMGEKY